LAPGTSRGGFFTHMPSSLYLNKIQNANLKPKIKVNFKVALSPLETSGTSFFTNIRDITDFLILRVASSH
jgi:hypothetical protein